MDITNNQKIFQIVAYQTILVKPCYNCFMGRNYFSKKGGPYFINDGFSQHDHDHKPSSNHQDTKPDNEAVFIAIGFVSLVVLLSIVMIAL